MKQKICQTFLYMQTIDAHMLVFSHIFSSSLRYWKNAIFQYSLVACGQPCSPLSICQDGIVSYAPLHMFCLFTWVCFWFFVPLTSCELCVFYYLVGCWDRQFFWLPFIHLVLFSSVAGQCLITINSFSFIFSGTVGGVPWGPRFC